MQVYGHWNKLAEHEDERFDHALDSKEYKHHTDKMHYHDAKGGDHYNKLQAKYGRGAFERHEYDRMSHPKYKGLSDQEAAKLSAKRYKGAKDHFPGSHPGGSDKPVKID